MRRNDLSCQDTQTLIHGYLDGELDLVRNIEVEGHLKECPACAHAYQNQMALRSAIKKGSLYHRSPTGLARQVRSALREANQAEAQSPVREKETSWWPSWRPAWVSLGFAASLALIALISWRLAPRVSGPSSDELVAQEVLDSHVRSLMANHLTDVPSTDQHTVKPWFNGKLDFSPPVEDLADQGFPLIGGRLDYLAGRPVAALVYQRRKHFINVFIWPSTHDAAQKALKRQGYNLLSWSQSGMTYWVVSDVNNNDLLEFGQRLQGLTSK
jgi:anti-sigma factor RsiW